MTQIIFAFLIGVLLGFLVKTITIKKRVFGAIRIDRSDPYDGPYLFLELKRGPDELSKNRTAIFEIKNENFVNPRNKHPL